MGLLVSMGVFFLSMSVSIVVAAQLLLPRPHLMVLSISSAFAYSMATIVSASLWFAIPPLKSTYGWLLFVSTTNQELARLLMYLVFAKLKRMGDGVEAFLRPGTRNGLLSGLATGLGFGATSVLVNFYSIVGDSYLKDTAIYIPACPKVNFFVAGASLSLASSVVHILCGLLVWTWYDEKWYIGVAGIYLVHLLVVCIPIGAQTASGCQAIIGAVWAVTTLLIAFSFVWTVRRVQQSAQPNDVGAAERTVGDAPTIKAN